jgi:two-component system chemotaxis sensor kinase CheA
MTPLLEQFLTEARESVEETSKGLLALEQRPADAELLDALFRRVHTLKGNAGLFGFQPLIEVSHAAEDVLDEVREGAVALDSELIDVLLQAVDAAAKMLDSIEQTGTIDAHFEREARAIAQRLHRPPLPAGTEPPEQSSPAGSPAPAIPEWIQRILSKEQDRAISAGQPLTFVRYTPEPECFFKGEDPLFTVRQAPGLAALSVRPREPWPPLEAMDVYKANLTYELLCRASAGQLEDHFRYVLKQVIIRPVPAEAMLASSAGQGIPSTAGGEADPSAGSSHLEDPSLLNAAAEILAAQRAVLDLPSTPEERPGRIASAGKTLEALLRATGRTSGLASLARALQQADAESSSEPLKHWLNSLQLASCGASPPGDPPSGMPSANSAPSSTSKRTQPVLTQGPATTVLKVPVAKVDRLMELVGEMVVAKNALPYLATRAESEFGSPELAREIKSQHAVIHRIVQEMQDGIQRVRMLPVGTVLQRFPRLVRDLSKALGKEVDLVMEGEDTEVDKHIVDALADPLVHILRNSLDHGIEPPAERVRSGKSPRGQIRIRASQEGDRVRIEIEDDGRGIDAQAVRRKAYEKRLISEEELESLSEENAIQLVFRPGFSTSETVTDVSGRGVGMDVVRRSLERVGGTVSLSSRLGRGTRILLSLPLSMAVSRVLQVKVGGQPFGIPLEDVLETVRVPLRQVHHVRGRSVTVLREQVIPLYSASELLGLNHQDREEQEGILILVVRCSSNTAGLIVDALSQALEVIVKPLDGPLAQLSGYAGAALLGDGTVLPVLNLKELL